MKKFSQLREEAPIRSKCPPATAPVDDARAKQFVTAWTGVLQKSYGCGFKFTHHFLVERLNHPRNRPQISTCDMTFVFNRFFARYSKRFAADVRAVKEGTAKARGKDVRSIPANELETVISSRSTGINIVFALKQERRRMGTAVIMPVTIMRKRQFGVNKGEQVLVEGVEYPAECVYEVD